MSDRATARGGAPAALDGAFLLQLLHSPKPAAPSPPPPPHSDPAVAAVGPSYAFPPHSFRPPPPPGFTPRPPDSHQNPARPGNFPARPDNSHHSYPGARGDAAVVENSRHNYPGARRDAPVVENSRHNYPGARRDTAMAENSRHNYPGARRDAAMAENSRHNYPSARRDAAMVENSRHNYPGADYGDRTPDSRFPQQDGARADNSPHNYPGARRDGFRAVNLHRGSGARGNDGFRADSLQHSFRSNDGGTGPRGPGERNAPNGYWKPVGNGGGVDEQRVDGRNFHHGLQGRPQGNYHRPVGEQFENYRRRDNGWPEDCRMNGERWGGHGGRSEYRPSSRGSHPGDAARSNLRSEDGSGRVSSSQNDGVQVSTNGSAADSGGDASEEQDVLADQLMQTLTLKDDPGEKKARRYKDLRLDSFRGHHVSSQRMRIHRREAACRFDIKTFMSNFLSIYRSLIPAEEEKEKQKQLLLMLEKLVAKEWPNAQLHIYGSCANSFGFSNSDIDICLAIDDINMIKSDVLLKLADILQADNLENVQALTHARVPIVKLMDPVTGISCDICINNLLAVVNTKLLRDYAQIDERLPQLAFIVKHWAKSRGVNETYRGTLSSYAYVLMCIHFLQLRRPAILPCLQEMEATYVVTVDDTRCAYFDRVEELHGFGAQNKENIAYLLWAFFQYWAYYYDYTDDVVSVRTGCIISKRSKEWTTRVGNDRHLICIEDPFETSHDLGRVVDKFTIKILREEFERAADILQYNPNPTVTLFEPYVPPAHNQLQSECL